MNNLTTRKIVLGLLMVLVLALSVQGIADALTFGTSRSGDFQIVLPNDDFSITFRPDLEGPEDVNDFLTPPGPRHKKASQADIEYATGDRTRSNVSVSRIVDKNYNDGVTTHYYTTSAEDTATVTGLVITTNTRNWGDPDNDPPVGQTWKTGNSTDRQYASRARTRSNVSVSRIVDKNYNDGVTTHYYTTSAEDTATVLGLVITTNTRNWVTEAAAYHYNAEQVTIAVITGGATLKKVGRYDAPSDGILTETGKDGSKLLDSSMTLTFTAPAAGAEQTITIGDSTAGGDYPTGVNQATSLTFTVYVVNFDSTTSSAVTLTGGTQIAEKLYAGDRSSQRAQPIFAGNTDDIPLVFRVEGGGQVYAREPARATDANREGPRSSGTREFLLSSAATVYLDMKGRTNTVRVHPRGTNPNNTGRTFIYVNGYANLNITHGDRQTGARGGRLEKYLGVQVTDSGGNRIPGMVVRFPAGTSDDDNGVFIPFLGTTVYVSNANALVGSATDATKEFIAEPSKHVGGANAMMVKTDSSGEAKVYYAFDSGATVGDKTISPGLMHASAVTAEFTATVATEGNTRTANLEILSGNPQSGAKGKKLGSPLVVIARSTGDHRIPNVIIQFRTVTGTLAPAPGTMQPSAQTADLPSGTLNPSSGQQIYVVTGANGEAGVTYNVGQTVVARDVIAEVRFEASTTQYDFAIDRVVFNVNGRAGTSQPSQPSQPAPAANTITLTLSSTTGEPGDEIDVTVTSSSSGDFVVIDDGDFSASDFDDLSGLTPHETTLTLPDEEDEYDFFAVGPGGVTSNEVTVTVEEEEVALGRLSIVAVGAPSNGQQTVRITVRDSDGALAVGAVSVTLTGTGVNRIVPTANGSGAAVIPVPNTVSVQAEGYRLATLTLTGTGQQEAAEEDEDEVEEEVVTVSEPDSVSIVGPSQRDGTANTVLDAALIVEVVDEDGDAVADARVIFRVRTGQGRLSERGRGRAIAVQTNSSGHARATYTPISASSTVEAEARGVTRRVTFTITASGGSAGPVSRDVDGTPSGDISPVVHVGAAQRPPMLWVDGGAIYALVGASPQRFASSVDNALNIAVAGGKVYWTETDG